MTSQVQDQVMGDAFASAENPQELKYTNEYWGEMAVDAYFCILEKGVGKVPFNPNQHSIDRRLTAITMNLMPVPASGLNFAVERDYIAEFRAWNAITLPSLKKIGVSLRDLDGKCVRAKLTETGETYVNNQGETKEKTVFEFLELYDSLDACEAAYVDENGNRSGRTPAASVPPITGGAMSEDKEKAAAEKFLEVAIKSAVSGKTDLDQAREAVAAQIAKMPMISKYFTVDSPETMNFMAQYMG